MIDLHITPDKPSYGTYKWSATSWANDGTLNGGVAEADFADVIYAGTGNDKIDGKGGNDALSGGAGNDTIDGGDGDDMIAGGAGNDNIKGGSGDDYISSSAGLTAPQRVKPSDTWNPPAGKQAVISSATWGVYLDTQADGDKITVWSGIGTTPTNTASTEADNIDGGAGNDAIMASWADDRIQGGAGDDQIDGLAGNDVIEGGDGDDIINADGITKAGFLNSVAAVNHGSDFADGGDGKDDINGGGKDDQLFGGAGDDKIWGDSSIHYQLRSCSRTYSLVKTSIRYPKTVQKASPDACRLRRRARTSTRFTPNSIAACAYKQGFVATFDSQNSV